MGGEWGVAWSHELKVSVRKKEKEEIPGRSISMSKGPVAGTLA